MRRDLVIGGISAAVIHAVILFGFHLGSQAVALPFGETPEAIEVSLVAGPTDEPAAATATAPAEEPPPPDPTPPDSTPPPEPAPTQPDPVPAPAASEPSPTAQPPHPPIREPAPKSHPHASVSARAHTEAPAGNPNPTSLATGLPGGAKGGKSHARYRTNPNPEYPTAARTQHQEGVVLLSVEVSAEGRPTSISLARSSGFPLLDQAAIAGVRRWTFDPARAAGFPIASTEQVPVRFRLDR
jgi:protein TonB